MSQPPKSEEEALLDSGLLHLPQYLLRLSGITHHAWPPAALHTPRGRGGGMPDDMAGEAFRELERRVGGCKTQSEIPVTLG